MTSEDEATPAPVQRLVWRYAAHLGANWCIAWKGAILAVFHLAHGVIPCNFTDHEWWQLNLHKTKDNKGVVYDGCFIDRKIEPPPADPCRDQTPNARDQTAGA
jgi:hypothetical protein